MMGAAGSSRLAPGGRRLNPVPTGSTRVRPARRCRGAGRGQEYSGHSTLEWRDVASFQVAAWDGRLLDLRVVAGSHGWSGAPLEADSSGVEPVIELEGDRETPRNHP